MASGKDLGKAFEDFKREIRAELHSFKQSVEHCSESCDSVNAVTLEMKTPREELVATQNSNEKLAAENKQLQMKVEELEQYSWANNLEIKGVPDEGEPFDTVQKICVAMGEPLPDNLRSLVVAEDFASDDDDSDDYEDENDYSDDACNATSPDQCGPSGTAEEESLDGSSLAEMPTDLENCLALNCAHWSLLESAIGELAERLEKNRQLQRELLAQLSQRAWQPPKPRVHKKWHHTLVFHHPYFRDVNGMQTPMNEDERAKRANKELDPYLAPSMPWTTDENRLLEKLEILREVDAGKQNKNEIARKHDIPRSTLSTYIRNKMIEDSYVAETFAKDRKRLRTAKHPDLEAA
ncbi:hypothetical protein HPB49_005376 [Dermacentor silvarum]|uniref:Uncharacterized protein n=1 Tax=Dermacentor silvarum TaxID=543639 RepID=A0ACB8DV35_DERSI|nr:hypothetical protein HPB49_005376 [Dermacentor silvarum]